MMLELSERHPRVRLPGNRHSGAVAALKRPDEIHRQAPTNSTLRLSLFRASRLGRSFQSLGARNMAQDVFLKNLTQKRARVWNQAEALLDRADRAKRSFNAEEEREWRRMNDEIDSLDLDIRERQRNEEREAEAAVAREAWSGIVAPFDAAPGQSPQEAEDIQRLLYGVGPQRMDVDLAGIAAEKRLIRQGADGRELRGFTVGSNAGGGYAIPSTLARRIWDYLELYTSVRQAGPTIITTDSGESLNVPTVASHGTAVLTGEGSALSENDATLGTVKFGSYKYGNLTTLSHEVLADQSADLMGLVALDCARAVGRATDTDYTTGVGTTGPQGYLPQLGTAGTAQTLSTGVPSFNDLLDVEFGIAAPYRELPCAWMMAPSSVKALRKIKDTTGRGLWAPSYELGTSDTLLGYPVTVSPNLPAFSTAATTRPIVFGHWPTFGIRDVASVRFESSEDFKFDTDTRAVRAVLRTDSRILDTHGLVCMLEPTT
jgi:HK97 family phage major capsid protein